MRSTNLIKTARAGYIVLSAIIAALGVLMLARPGYPMAVVCRVAGVLTIAFGVIKLMGYSSRDLYQLAFQHDLALGLLLVALGLALLLRRGWAVNMMCLALGVAIFTEGLFRVQMSLDARRFGLESWWLIMALAVLTGGVGVALIANPFRGMRALFRLLGASLLADGVLNLCVALCAVKIIARRQSDFVEYSRY